MPVPFASKSYRTRAPQVSAERIVNGWPRTHPETAMSQLVIDGCPGIVSFASCGVGPVRGAHLFKDESYFVSGQNLWRVDKDGNSLNLGGNIGDGRSRVAMDDNGDEICIVDGTDGWLWDPANGVREITDEDFKASNSVTYQDGYFLFDEKDTGYFYRSDLLDGFSYSALAYASAESSSDDVVAVQSHKQILYVFG